MEKSVLLVLQILAPFALALGITHRSWIRRKSNLLDWDKHFLLALACCLLLALGAAGYGALAAFPDTWIYECLDAVFSLLEGDSKAFRSLTLHTPMLSKWLPVLTPLLAAGTVLVLLWNHLPHHIPIGYRVWYVFSELEPHSIHLAGSLKDENVLFIFLRTRRQDVSHELLEQLERINYWFYPKTETSLLKLPWRRGKCLRFFFLSENTDENFRRMDQFLQDIKKYRLFSPKKDSCAENQFQQELYLLSETESAPMLIDRLRGFMMDGKERLPVFRNAECRLLDRNRAISYALLRKKPLYESCSDDRTNVLVLGFGRIGREFFRAASSIGIMPNRWLGFTLCDLQIGERWAAFVQQCPETNQPNVITKAINVESEELENLVNDKQYHYIVVALGDDEVNIRVATWLKRHYRLRHWQDVTAYQPQICVNVEDEIKSDYIQKLWTANQPWDLDLCVFGTMPQVFSAETLLPRQLWAAAAYLHQQIMGKSTRNWGEYERRSSLACAMHGIYHAESKTYIADDQKDKLIEAEHHRWMAYVRSEGMRLASEEMVRAYAGELHSHVDVKGRLTPCLINGEENLRVLYTQLSQNRNIPSMGNIPFWDRDEKVVDHADEIVRYFEHCE